MDEAPGASDDPRELRRLSEILNRNLKKRGVYCGVPDVHPGEEFVLAENDSPAMRTVRAIVTEMRLGEKVATTETGASGEEAAQTPEPVVRNSWSILRGHGASVKQFQVRIIEVNPEAPEMARRVRLEKNEVDSPPKERFHFALQTILTGGRALPATERKALTKLRELVGPARYEGYLINGAILEQGKSGVVYVICKHRPTLALRMPKDGVEGKVLCSLCLHPIGYFHGTWAGALPPTDEVIAHLLFIRGGEHFFWRKTNHIPIDEPNSGI